MGYKENMKGLKEFMEIEVNTWADDGVIIEDFHFCYHKLGGYTITIEWTIDFVKMTFSADLGGGNLSKGMYKDVLDLCYYINDYYKLTYKESREYEMRFDDNGNEI